MMIYGYVADGYVLSYYVKGGIPTDVDKIQDCGGGWYRVTTKYKGALPKLGAYLQFNKTKEFNYLEAAMRIARKY